jgi:hypothetical protein
VGIHVNGAMGDGYTVVDYWSSKAARDAFMESKVGPAVAALGIDVEPVIEELQVHNALTQKAAANV